MPLIQSQGESQVAQYVQGRLVEYNRFQHKSTAMGAEQVIREELADVWEECSEDNWDGYDALPVSRESFLYAQRFLLSLSLGSRRPSVSATPNGDVTLEWYSSPRRSLTIAITSDGELHYAALLGPGHTCGKEPFFGEAPKTILDLISRVFGC
jgi:hypothetical protein